jgi:hypothetical protein
VNLLIQVNEYVFVFKHLVVVAIIWGTFYFVSVAAEHESDVFNCVASAVKISLLILLPYCILEVLAYRSGFRIFGTVLNIIEPFFHGFSGAGSNPFIPDGYFGRVRGFAMEPSYLAPVLSFLHPWIFVKVMVKPKIFDFGLLTCLYAVAFFSLSRNVGLALTSQLVVLIILFYKGGHIRSLFTVCLTVAILTLALGILIYYFDDIYYSLTNFRENSHSNTMRFESAVAAFNISINNPFFGAGYVDIIEFSRFYRDNVYNIAASVSWLQGRAGGATTFSLPFRILMETGFVGMILFLGSWVLLIKGCYKRFVYSLKYDYTFDRVSAVLIVILVGLLLNSFSVDSYLFLGYWIAWGLAAGNISRPNFATR